MTPGQRAVAEVERAGFIPDTVYLPDAETGWLVPLHREREPDRWRRLVDSDEPVVTAVDFDPRLPEHLRDLRTGRGVVSTSSSSAPPIVARMLDALDVSPGHRVLEIGTGTGWNAALLAHLGAEVVSVEVNPGIAERARERLRGHRVEVVAGDGAAGHQPGAPYDRVVATASVTGVPYAWVEQTRPGGILVVPWAPVAHPDAPLAVLTVTGDAARGRFTVPAPFMPMSGERLAPEVGERVRAWWEREGRPAPERFGVTVDRAGSRVWLDDPGNAVPLPLGA